MKSLVAISMSVVLPMVPNVLGLGTSSFPDQRISQPRVDAPLSIPIDLGEGPKFVLNGAYGGVNLPSVPVLMNAVSGLADLAHLDSKRRIRGFHVPTLPNYTEIDISIHPAWPETDFEAQYGVFGLYCVIYNMITTKTFRNSTFGLGQGGPNLVIVEINKRSKPTNAVEASFHVTNNSTSQDWFLVGITNATSGTGDRGLQHFFELMDEPSETIAPQDVFITIMATLKNVALEEDEEPVNPFQSGALGFGVRFQSLPMDTPRTTPPFLTYGYLIDTIKQIPGYMIQEKRFGGIMIIIMFGEDIIGEAVLRKGTPDFPSLGYANNNVSTA